MKRENPNTYVELVGMDRITLFHAVKMIVAISTKIPREPKNKFWLRSAISSYLLSVDNH